MVLPKIFEIYIASQRIFKAHPPFYSPIFCWSQQLKSPVPWGFEWNCWWFETSKNVLSSQEKHSILVIWRLDHGPIHQSTYNVSITTLLKIQYCLFLILNDIFFREFSNQHAWRKPINRSTHSEGGVCQPFKKQNFNLPRMIDLNSIGNNKNQFIIINIATSTQSKNSEVKQVKKQKDNNSNHTDMYKRMCRMLPLCMY